MLLVLLSLFYFSSDECTEECEESRHVTKKDEVAVTKTTINTRRLKSKKLDKHEPKIARRRPVSSRFQTTIKDSRIVHCVKPAA
ncbi:hypothetical protein Fmac_007170 [Flemingia macrophylla]|uniref:Secreted protein n=1 Tax=Flemingia macrophylla TaxID=520843 RepID=A0ABD1NCP1_9FABA